MTKPDDRPITKAAFARRIGVSPRTLQRYFRENYLDGRALAGKGREAGIRPAVAIEQLRQFPSLHANLGGERVGGVTVGGKARTDDADAIALKGEQLLRLKLNNKRLEDQRRDRAGTYVLAADVPRALRRIGPEIVASINSAASRKALADHLAAQFPEASDDDCKGALEQILGYFNGRFRRSAIATSNRYANEFKATHKQPPGGWRK